VLIRIARNPLTSKPKCVKIDVLFDGTLGDRQTGPVSFELKPDAKPSHSRAFPVPPIHIKTLKKGSHTLVELAVLKRQPSSE